MIPFVDFDTNGDGEPDYETYATYLPGTDVLVAATYDLNDPDQTTVDVQPVNFNYGDVDTNVFDTNVLTLPVSKKLVGLNSGRRKPITYTVGTYDPWAGEDIDDSDAVSFDVGKPALRTGARCTATRAASRSTTPPRDRHRSRRWCCTCTVPTASGPRCSRCPGRRRRTPPSADRHERRSGPQPRSASGVRCVPPSVKLAGSSQRS